MSTIVITGARGYIGGVLAEKLASEGHALRLVSRSLEALTARTGNIEYYAADLCDPQSWSRLLRGAHAIVHLSARTDLRRAEADPANDRVINVEPIRSLVRAAEQSKATIAVIYASSTSIVGDTHIKMVNEDTPDRPCSVYDRNKLECEIILRDATHRGVLRACSLRLPTVYGYGAQSTNPNRGVLNVMIRRAIRGEPLTLYSDGSYVRDFIHVDDVCNAFRLAIASPRICNGRHYIVATGRGYTLAEAFRCVEQEAYRATGRKAEICLVPEPADLHAVERMSCVGDASLFQKLTGWRPQVDLEGGIRDYFQRIPAHSAVSI
jgi:nucleoside-diphosphate-sugar epimerase